MKRRSRSWAAATVVRFLIGHSMLGKNKIAMEDFSKAIELDPAELEALTNRARLYQAAGKMQLAKRDLARVKELKAQASSNVSANPAPPEQNTERSP
jgi:tetratricopeptide (TPR) repeat protein